MNYDKKIKALEDTIKSGKEVKEQLSKVNEGAISIFTAALQAKAIDSFEARSWFAGTFNGSKAKKVVKSEDMRELMIRGQDVLIALSEYEKELIKIQKKVDEADVEDEEDDNLDTILDGLKQTLKDLIDTLEDDD